MPLGCRARGVAAAGGRRGARSVTQAAGSMVGLAAGGGVGV